MSEPTPPEAQQSKHVDVFGQHMAAEFRARNADQALETMTEHPHIVFAPTLVGGEGREGARAFYANTFLSQLPPDIRVTPLSRTVGATSLVDEMVLSFTHTLQMDWILPGVAPTGRKVEVVMVVVVGFKEGKVDSEHLYWDQASVLVQVGLLDSARVPAVGTEAARRLRSVSAAPKPAAGTP
jgi:carboxymethylenebutenolidase